MQIIPKITQTISDIRLNIGNLHVDLLESRRDGSDSNTQLPVLETGVFPVKLPSLLARLARSLNRPFKCALPSLYRAISASWLSSSSSHPTLNAESNRPALAYFLYFKTSLRISTEHPSPCKKPPIPIVVRPSSSRISNSRIWSFARLTAFLLSAYTSMMSSMCRSRKITI